MTMLSMAQITDTLVTHRLSTRDIRRTVCAMPCISCSSSHDSKSTTFGTVEQILQKRKDILLTALSGCRIITPTMLFVVVSTPELSPITSKSTFLSTIQPSCTKFTIYALTCYGGRSSCRVSCGVGFFGCHRSGSGICKYTRSVKCNITTAPTHRLV